MKHWRMHKINPLSEESGGGSYMHTPLTHFICSLAQLISVHALNVTQPRKKRSAPCLIYQSFQAYNPPQSRLQTSPDLQSSTLDFSYFADTRQFKDLPHHGAPPREHPSLVLSSVILQIPAKSLERRLWNSTSPEEKETR